MAYCILSCDGGGIRGLLPSLLIQKIAADVPGFLGNVNLFAGTSAGGLVSLGLAGGVSIDSIVSMFAQDGPQIFTPYPSSSTAKATPSSTLTAPSPGESWFQWIMAHLEEILEGIAFVKYTNTGLKTLLSGLLPGKTLAELASSVLVTTFQLDDTASGNWAPITISNLPNDPSAATYPIDAALSTSAAPTYFPPYQHPTFGYCIDGGVFANNPGSMALAAAVKSGVALSDIVMLSIGTGSFAENMQVIPPATNYGPLMWMLPLAMNTTPAAPLISILMDGVSGGDTFVCQQILGANYLRLQVPLPFAIPLDDYQDVSQLESAANTYMTGAAWTQAESWIRQMFVPTAMSRTGA
jgi:patatin-like phospholipase/acyl hydrolase